MFELLRKDIRTAARHARLSTSHGNIETPAFMPVGTQGSVKAVSPDELRQLAAQIVLGNTYHLFVRPGMDVIRHFGGLHRFMSWAGPILTDSGGYQIFSLTKLRKIRDDGVEFQNHVDGAVAFLSPETVMEFQAVLDSDIAMVLDECPPWPCEYEYAARSLELTLRWAKRCKDVTSAAAAESRQDVRRNANATARQIFGIVQGATFPELRRQAAQALVEMDFDGYAIGGVSVGEPEDEMMRAIEASVPSLPQDKPRYAMGLGTPPQMLELIARGIDMFDCVLPTRLARNGTAFTAAGTLSLKNSRFALDKGPIEEDCACPACVHFTRGYIRHLIKAEEILGLRLITLHNLHFYLDLMRQARQAINQGYFDSLCRDFSAKYKSGPNET